ncbi:stage III sporulation protein AH [Herbinix hemicellulosilytica]|uniref:Putative membrane protein n=1 Tax=Herbinix hemicellulosilytica TaxID=1564487 RepID=A0A0H5SE35_HERHM|nr:SpoIIIAH-like family protein [Herbinix hemicellulosilytica]RBP57574.1 stage III sporulation protein AH [Herbinix hemicellulosilytica]CRZ33682.1 putative membrane protein [Herbinix hemicellulosilytica]
MKNIFKKNQIIITALAIMIVIAGYLSFTSKDKPDEEDSLVTANPDYEVISGMDGELFAQDVGTDDTTTDDTNDTTDDTTDDTADTTDTDQDVTATEEDDDTPVDVDEDTDNQELGDISDEDLLASANDVKDTGELDIKEQGVPGEAVLASTTLDGNFFISKKLEREQDRARSKADLQAMIESNSISEDAKQPIIERMIELTRIAEIENNTEIMLEAKGFADAMVTMNADGDVNVVINAPSLSDQQLAIIEEIVMKETNAPIEKITINPVVVAE